MARPITLEALESREDDWLNSADNDQYGSCSYFVYKYFSDEEKMKLWQSRGDKKQFRWRPGMRRPEVV